MCDWANLFPHKTFLLMSQVQTVGSKSEFAAQTSLHEKISC